MLNCPLTGKVCMKHKAFHVTNIKNNDVGVVNICEDCLSQIKDLKELEEKKEEKVENNENSYYCEFCKLTIEELLKNSRLGCEKCYEVFEKPLILAFDKLQRTPDLVKKELKHVGSIPSQWKKKQARETDPKKFLLELKQKLILSIKDEKYEKSKKFKDAIYAFECYLGKIDEFKNDEEQKNLILEQVFEFIYKFREKELEE